MASTQNRYEAVQNFALIQRVQQEKLSFLQIRINLQCVSLLSSFFTLGIRFCHFLVQCNSTALEHHSSISLLFILCHLLINPLFALSKTHFVISIPFLSVRKCNFLQIAAVIDTFLMCFRKKGGLTTEGVSFAIIYRDNLYCFVPALFSNNFTCICYPELSREIAKSAKVLVSKYFRP